MDRPGVSSAKRGNERRGSGLLTEGCGPPRRLAHDQAQVVTRLDVARSSCRDRARTGCPCHRELSHYLGVKTLAQGSSEVLSLACSEPGTAVTESAHELPPHRRLNPCSLPGDALPDARRRADAGWWAFRRGARSPNRGPQWAKRFRLEGRARVQPQRWLVLPGVFPRQRLFLRLGLSATSLLS